ncbi:aspartyl protease family protein [Candidatus Uhrbacteria bacterium]|nr:aspartyl protease family protein [Candidatus Uhrbacteria bacterium]
MKFSYERIDVAPSLAFPHVDTTLRPIIPITLEHSGIKAEYGALIDSGADFCIFHPLVAKVLGLELGEDKKAVFSGVGGNGMTAYFHTITAHVGNYPYQLYCGFSHDIPPDGYGILGQIGFFDHFRVVLDYKQEEIEIHPEA